MNEELKNYEKSIKKKHSFAWTPNYQESFATKIEQEYFLSVVLKTLEKLEWNSVYQDKIRVEAKCTEDGKTWTEKIIISFEQGNVIVKSLSLNNEIWDNGKNSKRVKIFIHAFKQFENEINSDSATNLIELSQELEDQNNWKDYQIPESLPQPTDYKKQNPFILLFGGILSSLVMGFLIALFSVHVFYIFILIETLVAFAMGFVLCYLIKQSNYTNYDKLNYILLGLMVIIYVSNQYFQYEIIFFSNEYEPISFVEFIKIRLEQGLTLESLNLGWIGLVISWIFQIGFSYFISSYYLALILVDYQVNKIPAEVIDYAFYFLIIKEETEQEVRDKLSNMGWKNTLQQDEVFAAIGAIYTANEINRMV